ncbi:dihydrolipoamide acetyltransferase family protein [Cytobacillus sp. FSL W7-1323]|uniref:dihydrolipoamide acetyltransferase family protein n=1 Tax=Cytobacillus TaxID=2675230 RepID=UPI001CD797A6|nr:dihydrolipoamide acetyltransferase family protein [Cytobacillus kochii]MCA1027782.1 2-oxo acid dehydrogenase subunit E2 [Cytobacillus kochii]
MTDVKFSDIGEGMTEGEIIHYFVKEGDTVEIDQPLVELQTDKMVAEIPAPSAGVITSIPFQTGEVVTVGTVIMTIDNGQSLAKREEVVMETVPPRMEKEVPPEANGNRYQRILAAPYTRKIARDLNIDIERIVGTGPAGRVMDDDVYQFVEGYRAKETKKERTEPQVETTKLEETIPFTGIRKVIAQRMSHSLLTIPHVTHYDEVDVTQLLEARNELKDLGDRLSPAAFFLKAVVICLKEHPLFNARLDEEAGVIRLLKDYHIGVATHGKEGLMVPVIHQANQKSVRAIHEEMKSLTKKAQEGKLTPNDMKGGTFTVNNVGPLGRGTGATPIINHPETSIITFHAVKKKPVVNAENEIVIRSIMNISISFDHRVIDGAQSIAFSNRFIELIEQPTKLLVELI